MPIKKGRDKKGTYYRWGNQKKYYYKTEAERKQAKRKAIIQGYVIKKRQSGFLGGFLVVG